jgi:NitT/TauT family transport system substrate-binding protein
MKRFVCSAFVVVMSAVLAFGFSACGKTAGKSDVTFYVPDGAPLLSAAELLADENAVVAGHKLKVNVVSGANLGPVVIAGTPDVALAPINVCATGYNKNGGGYVLAGVSVWGLNHIVTNLADASAVTSLSDLIGEVIYAFQPAGTPGLTLKELLNLYSAPYTEFTADDKAVDPNKVNIEYLASAAVVRDAMLNGYEGETAAYYKFGLLAEPAVSAVAAGGKIKRLFDVQELWSAKKGYGYPQVGVIIKRSLIESDAAFAAALVSRLAGASFYTRNFPSAAADAALNKLNSTELPANAAVIEAFINGKGQAAFNFTSAPQAKTTVNEYLTAIKALESNILGGDVPGDDFYL